MSAGDIRKISEIQVTNNVLVFSAAMSVVTGNGNTYPLSPEVKSGQSIIFDLTKVQGLNNGDIIKVRLVEGGMDMTNEIELTYDKDTPDQGCYITGGTPSAIFIHLQKCRTDLATCIRLLPTLLYSKKASVADFHDVLSKPSGQAEVGFGLKYEYFGLKGVLAQPSVSSSRIPALTTYNDLRLEAMTIHLNAHYPCNDIYIDQLLSCAPSGRVLNGKSMDKIEESEESAKDPLRRNALPMPIDIHYCQDEHFQTLIPVSVLTETLLVSMTLQSTRHTHHLLPCQLYFPRTAFHGIPGRHLSFPFSQMSPHSSESFPALELDSLTSSQTLISASVSTEPPFLLAQWSFPTWQISTFLLDVDIISTSPTSSFPIPVNLSFWLEFYVHPEHHDRFTFSPSLQ
ncbi:hypothetical protein C8J56DRAFT_1171451 [Mycena floridula]|nr:hypothetical protein C8J56DRAFT_1171451 [Mycena floridula]